MFPLINVCKTCLGLVIEAIRGFFFLFKDPLGLFTNLSGHDQIPRGWITVFPKCPSWGRYRSAAITNKSKHDLFGRESFQYQEKPGPMKSPSIKHSPPPSAPFVSNYVHSPQRQSFCKMSIRPVKLKKDEAIEIF